MAVDRGLAASAKEAGIGLIDPESGFLALEAALKWRPLPGDRFPGGLAPVAPPFITRRIVFLRF